MTKLLASTGATVGTYPVGTNPGAIAFDGTNIWVANSQSSSVTKLLASTGATVGTFTDPVGPPTGLAFDGTNIWVLNNAGYSAIGSVTKLLASTGAAVGTYPVAAPSGIIFDGTNIWVTDASQSGSSVTKLLASTGELMGTYALSGVYPGAMAYDGTNIWVANYGTGTVTKLLASTGATVGLYPVGATPSAIAFDGTNIWVTNSQGSSVTKLLASTGAVAATYTVGSSPGAIVFDGTNIWVANEGSNSVTKINPMIQPPLQPPSISQVVPVYSTTEGTIQPGELISIWGNNLASGSTVWNNNFPASLGGTSVTINTKPAYLLYAGPTQINLQAPDDSATGLVNVVVTTAVGSTTSTVTLGKFGPSFFLYDATHVAGIIPRSDGSGAYAASGGGTYDILGPTGTSLGYQTVAAKAGDIVELYGTGFGPTNPAVPAGQVFSGAAPTINQVALYINNVSVVPTFAGLSGAGVDQINLTVPAGLGKGGCPTRSDRGGTAHTLDGCDFASVAG